MLFINQFFLFQVRKINARRKQLNMNEKKELQAVQMFFPVVVILLICNICPLAVTHTVRTYYYSHRENVSLLILSVCINSAVNFLVYYWRGRTFRREVEKACPWLKVAKFISKRFDHDESTTEAKTPTGSTNMATAV